MQNFGGVATIDNTLPLNTWNSGPVAGILGGLYFGELYGLENIAMVDTGGTSFDVSVISDSSYSINTDPLIERFRCQGYIGEVKSIGAGGGSIAWINKLTNRIEVGPQSAGGYPGPAAYGMGGEEPTVTDADILLGIINPDYFNGGKIKLSKELAQKAIKDKIADPLGIDEVEAAKVIIKTLNGKMRNLIYREISGRGYFPEDFTIMAIGGLGPTHCTEYTEELGINQIYTFLYSPVFSALGASVSDVVHQYWISDRIGQLMNNLGEYREDEETFQAFNSRFEALEKKAIADCEKEGFAKDQIQFTYESEMKYGTQLSEILLPLPVGRLSGRDDVKKVCNAFTENYDRTYGEIASYTKGGIDIESFILRATVKIPRPHFHRYKKGEATPSAGAKKGKRDVFFIEEDSWIETNIYDREKLSAGNIVEGPAIIEAINTTYKVPKGWKFVIDELLNGIYEKA